MAPSSDYDLVDALLLQMQQWQDELRDLPAATRIERLSELATEKAAIARVAEPDQVWAALSRRLRSEVAELRGDRGAVDSGARPLEAPAGESLVDRLVGSWDRLEPDERERILRKLERAGIGASAVESPPASLAPTELADHLATQWASLKKPVQESIRRRLGDAGVVAGTGGAVDIRGLSADYFGKLSDEDARLGPESAGRLLAVLLSRMAMLYVEATQTWAHYEGERRYARHNRPQPFWLADILRDYARTGDLADFDRQLGSRLALIEAQIESFRLVEDAASSGGGVECACLKEMIARIRPDEIEKRTEKDLLGRLKWDRAWAAYGMRFRETLGDHPALLERLRDEVAQCIAERLVNHPSGSWDDRRG